MEVSLTRLGRSEGQEIKSLEPKSPGSGQNKKGLNPFMIMLAN